MINVEALDCIISHSDILDHPQQKIKDKRNIISSYLQELNDQIMSYIDPEIDYSSLKRMHTTDELHDVLYELYDSDEKSIKDMKNKIKIKYEKNYFSHHGERCPYCGILRQSPSALDHFLPRSIFPEYSILSNNLIYICETCNNRAHKGSLINDADGKRIFLNPYTDKEIATNSFISCSIRTDNLIVLSTFTINKTILDVNESLYHIACNHMQKLKLNDRYSSLVENDLLQKFRNKFTNLNIETRARHYKNDITLKSILSFVDDKIEECDASDLNNWEIIFWKEFRKETVWFSTLAGKELEDSNL